MGRRCFVSGFLGLAVIMLFVGCSHNNIRSNDNIARAQAAIDNAQKSQGWTYAPVEMKAAQDNFPRPVKLPAVTSMKRHPGLPIRWQSMPAWPRRRLMPREQKRQPAICGIL